MADPLSISASIVALLLLTATVVKFLRDVKDAPTDIKQLILEISGLSGFLTMLKDAADSRSPDDLATIGSLDSPSNPLEQCRVQLARLADIAQAKGGTAWAAIKFSFKKGEVADILGVIERQKTLLGLAVQNDHDTLLRAIKEQNVAIKDGVQELQMAEKDRVNRKILDWISPLNFKVKQADVFGRREPGTGEWLLETDEFKNWVNGSERILWCSGLPGAGKTVLASIVVDHLQQTHQMNETVSIAYVYCSYKEQVQQTDCNLLACILQQLVEKAPVVPDRILSLYQKHITDKTRPNVNEWSELLQATVQKMRKVFVVVDALDECSDSSGGRRTFLAELRKLPDIRLLITSRPTLTLDWGYRRIVTMKISASDKDVEQYIKGRIKKEDRLERHVQADSTLRKAILSTIVKNAQGMFLLAQLHMDSLARKLTRKEVRKALERLPTTLDATYDEAMDRISKQNEEESALAKRVLSWISYAFEPLTVDQLRHALATAPGDTDLDEEDLIDQHLLVFVCAGLVTIDQESNIIRLVHYTTQNYFERVRDNLFPGAQTCIATTCITYLSFDQFANGHCRREAEMEIRLQKNPLLTYAARYWGDHARGEPECKVKALALEFLKQQSKVSCYVQAAHYRYPGFALQFPRDVTGLHVAASLGLEETTGVLLTWNTDVNAADSDAQTVLQAAAKGGHVRVVDKLLAAGADANAAGFFWRTALQAAAERGHVEVVERLLAAGADVNPTGGYSETALQVAARGEHLEVVERLLAAGGDVNAAAGISGRTALQAAAEGGNVEIVERLLAAGADVNADSAEYDHGRTALHKAAESGHVEVVERLLAAGADVNVVVRSSRQTPLQAATEGGHVEVVVRLLDAGADANAPAGSWERTALQAAAARGLVGLAVRLLVAGADVNAATAPNFNRTALQAAADGGNVELVERLLAAGADVNAAAAPNCGLTALQAAVWGGHVELVERLLATGADVNAAAAPSFGLTALQAAAEIGHVGVLERLLAAGADANAAPNHYGLMALHVAALEGRVQVVGRLLTAGADVNATSRYGETALQVAAESGHVGVVERLLAVGADVNTAPNYHGLTALQAAAERGHVEVVKKLQLTLQSQ